MMQKVMLTDPFTKNPTTPTRLENKANLIMIWNHPDICMWLDWDSENCSDVFTYEDFKKNKRDHMNLIKRSCTLACLVQ